MSTSNPEMNTPTVKQTSQPRIVNESSEFRTMKIYDATAVTLEKLSAQINGSGPKRVQWKDIVKCAVQKVTMSDLKNLREQKLTASDRFDEMFETFRSKNPKANRELFLEQLMRNVNPKVFDTAGMELKAEVARG